MVVENHFDLLDVSLLFGFEFIQLVIVDHQLGVHFHEFILVHFVALKVQHLELSEISEVLSVDKFWIIA